MIRRNTIVLGALTAVSLSSLGCTFYARSPQQYRDDTAKVLETRSAEISSCYDTVLKTTPAASGRVTVTFPVEEKTGKIVDTKADSARTTAAQPLIDCVVNALNGLMLQPPDQRKGEATFDYDFSVPAAPAPATT
jgi:hypothetical protein